MIYLGIDPGPVESAFVWWDAEDERVIRLESIPAFRITAFTIKGLLREVDHVSIEWIECFGMAVGQETFRTVAGIGWFASLLSDFDRPLRLVPRRAVKMHLCNSMRAKVPMSGRPLSIASGLSGPRNNRASSTAWLPTTGRH